MSELLRQPPKAIIIGVIIVFLFIIGAISDIFGAWEGLKNLFSTGNVSNLPNSTPSVLTTLNTGQIINYAIIAVLSLIVVFLLYNRYYRKPGEVSQLREESRDQSAPKKSYLKTPTKLTLELVEGNEYEFTFPENSKTHHDDDHILPNPKIVLHLRIENETSFQFHILSIKAGFLRNVIGIITERARRSTEKPSSSKEEDTNLESGFMMASFEVVGLNKNSYPIILNPFEIIKCNMETTLHFTTHYNPAQFATRLAKIPSQILAYNITIQVETKSSDGETLNLELEHRISLKPLKDLYITLWQTQNRQDLLEMANIQQRIVHIPKPVG